MGTVLVKQGVGMMSEFCPVIWPEEPVPECWKGCRECGLYEQGSRMVWGEGNPQAPIMIILDNPGAREGNSFVCGREKHYKQQQMMWGLQWMIYM
jgi:DNA polymerase